MDWLTKGIIKDHLQRACSEAGSQKAWAETHGIAPSYVTDVLADRREPGKAILEALGFERVTVYRTKEGQ